MKGKHRRQMYATACKDKKRYSSMVEAERWMRAVIFAKGSGPVPMSAYQCDFCGGFHFGRIPQRRLATADSHSQDTSR